MTYEEIASERMKEITRLRGVAHRQERELKQSENTIARAYAFIQVLADLDTTTAAMSDELRAEMRNLLSLLTGIDTQVLQDRCEKVSRLARETPHMVTYKDIIS